MWDVGGRWEAEGCRGNPVGCPVAMGTCVSGLRVKGIHKGRHQDPMDLQCRIVPSSHDDTHRLRGEIATLFPAS